MKFRVIKPKVVIACLLAMLIGSSDSNTSSIDRCHEMQAIDCWCHLMEQKGSTEPGTLKHQSGDSGRRGGGSLTIETVDVGDLENPADPETGLGQVDYSFSIGKYEITNSQYAAFLNAVAVTDTHDLYNPAMDSDEHGGIVRQGESGSYSYIIKNNFADRPVNFVSFWDAARFANWLHNGQPVGPQDNSTTEAGAYFLNGLTHPSNETVERSPAATWVIPSQNEWYKAAYHQPNASGGDPTDYWDYPTASISFPVEATIDAAGNITNPGVNVANYQSNGSGDTVSNVGTAGIASQGFYGTFDQAGNVQEWTDTIVNATLRKTLGGHWANWVFAMKSDRSDDVDPVAENPFWGFRVAKIVDPAHHPVSLLYIRAEFTDAPMGISDSLWLSRLMDVNEVGETFYMRDSFGQITAFEDDYTAILVLPEPSTGYLGIENVHKLKDHMRAAAANAGWDWTQYDHVVLSYPGVLNQPFGALATPGTVWLPGDNPWGPGFTHEMGHAFGVGHASAIEGAGVPYPGEHREGRDGLHMMGSDDARLTHTNIAMKYRMGFVEDVYLHQVNQSGVLRIHAFDLDVLPESSSQKLAAVVQADGKEFWVSFAPGMADVWSDFGGAVWETGVEVHELFGSSTRIIDFTPGSQGSGNTADYWDTRDGALVIGQSFQFPNSEVKISPLRTGVEPNGRKWIDVQISTTATDQVVPESVNIVSGTLAGGTVQELAHSDNIDYSVRRNPSSIASVVVIDAMGFSPVEVPAGIEFVFESSVFARSNVAQTISLFNYELGDFEVVDVRNASRFTDSVLRVNVSGDVSRFVQPLTGMVEARVRFQGSQNRQQFTANLDQLNWIIEN